MSLSSYDLYKLGNPIDDRRGAAEAEDRERDLANREDNFGQQLAAATFGIGKVIDEAVTRGTRSIDRTFGSDRIFVDVSVPVTLDGSEIEQTAKALEQFAANLRRMA